MDNQNELLKILTEIKEEVAGLRSDLGAQEKRVKALETWKLTAGLAGLDQPVPREVEAKIEIPTPPKPPVASMAVKAEEAPKMVKEKNESDKSSLEERIGGRWFARIGIVVTLFGLGFFLKYSFDNSWIGETGRVVIGILTGLIFLIAGEKIIKKYRSYGQVITGGGIAFLYLATYSAFGFYHLISSLTAFAFMVLVTIVGLALSWRYDAKAILAFSTLGGLLTPLLISTGENKQVELFSYIIMLDLAVLAISFWRHWLSVNLLGILGTWFIFIGWADRFYSQSQLVSTLLFATAFFLIYTLSCLANNLVKKVKSSGFEQALLVLSSFFYFCAIYFLLIGNHRDLLSLACILLAISYLGGAYGARKLVSQDASLYNFLASLAIVFTTLAIPIYFDKYLITAFWALEGIALLWLASSLKTEKSEEGAGSKNLTIIRLFALSVLFLSAFRSVFVDSDFYRLEQWPLLNEVFMSSLLVIISLYVGVALERRNHEQRQLSGLGTFLLILASCLTFLSVNRDIEHYYNGLATKEYNRVNELRAEEVERVGNRPIHEYAQPNRDYINLCHQRSWLVTSLFDWFYAIALFAWAFLWRKKTFFYFSFLSIALSFLGGIGNLGKVGETSLEVSWYRRLAILAVLAGFYLLAWFSRRFRNQDQLFFNWNKLLLVIGILANIFALSSFGNEISKHYQVKLNEANETINTTCYASLSAKTKAVEVRNLEDSCREARSASKRLQNMKSVSISIFWIFYAIGLLALGFWKRGKWFRLGGISLLAVSVVKLFLVDLWDLGALYRIISSITLGLSLLGISFAYQKYKHIFADIIKE